MGGAELALLGCILAGDLWSVTRIHGSRAGRIAKGLWTAVVLLLPLLGFVLWLLAGPRRPAADDARPAS